MEDRSETVDELDARVVADAVLDAQEHEELLHEGLVDVHYGVFLAFERVPKELLHPGACNPVTEKALFAVTFSYGHALAVCKEDVEKLHDAALALVQREETVFQLGGCDGLSPVDEVGIVVLDGGLEVLQNLVDGLFLLGLALRAVFQRKPAGGKDVFQVITEGSFLSGHIGVTRICLYFCLCWLIAKCLLYSNLRKNASKVCLYPPVSFSLSVF